MKYEEDKKMRRVGGDLPCRLQVDRIDYLRNAGVILQLDHFDMSKWTSGPIVSLFIVAKGSKDLDPLGDRGLCRLACISCLQLATAAYIWFLPIESRNYLFSKTHRGHEGTRNSNSTSCPERRWFRVYLPWHRHTGKYYDIYIIESSSLAQKPPRIDV